jgi:serine/threonine-protein kinase HipA
LPYFRNEFGHQLRQTMTSNAPAQRAYVWTWLPGQTNPVVAGALEKVGDFFTFTYGQSYRRRRDAVPLYLPELPVRQGVIEPLVGLTVAGCINDAAPDAWGRRVILNRLSMDDTFGADTNALDLMTYLLESGSDRTGALDFQTSSTIYVPRARDSAPLAELAEAVDRMEHGIPLSPALERALLPGSSLGGARPKALLDDNDRHLIAKFSSNDDTFPVVKGEFAAMELARRVGLDVAPVAITHAYNHDVLLVERFDRPADGTRRAMVSALTIFGLNELFGRLGSYVNLAAAIRERFTEPTATLRELFSRITFNILVGNTDDHARNHAAFWNPITEMLTLTPAYDICPVPRAGGEAAQAMAIAPPSWRMSQVHGCIQAAGIYGLSVADASAIVDLQVQVITDTWEEICDQAQMTTFEKNLFWQHAFLNPYTLQKS